MSTEEVRGVIQQWVKYVSALDYDGLTSLAVPDAPYFVAGLQARIPFAGTIPYADRIKQMPTVFNLMETITFTVLGITVEGDTAVLEMSPRGVSAEGKVYENLALIKFVVRDGKIQGVREYLDFFTLFEFLGTDV